MHNYFSKSPMDNEKRKCFSKSLGGYEKQTESTHKQHKHNKENKHIYIYIYIYIRTIDCSKAPKQAGHQVINRSKAPKHAGHPKIKIIKEREVGNLN